MLKRILYWARDRVSFLMGTLSLLDLMRIAEDENCDWQNFVSKIYEWEHARRVEIGKWLLALAAAILAAILALIARGDALPAYLLPAAGAGAGMFAASGILTFWSARSISAHLARTTTLVSRLVSIRTFLKRVRQEQGL